MNKWKESESKPRPSPYKDKDKDDDKDKDKDNNKKPFSIFRWCSYCDNAIPHGPRWPHWQSIGKEFKLFCCLVCARKFQRHSGAWQRSPCNSP